jgi:ParB-like chromosome segregation protein Spo0J
MADWHGNPDLQEQLAETDKLSTHPSNPRKGDVAGIATSLNRFGQVRPIVVTPDGVIVAGNHTYRAAKEILEWDRIAVTVFTGNEEEAAAYLLADNRWSDIGEYDDSILAELLADMADRGVLEGTGYTADAVDEMLAQLDKLATAAAEDFQGGYAETPEEMERRRQGYEQNRQDLLPMREVQLVMTGDQHKLFGEQVRALAVRYGTSGTTDTIMEAVKREWGTEWNEHSG